MRSTDVAAFVGEYPFRALPRTDAGWLLAHMDRVGVERAWVGHLCSFLRKDPAPDNAALCEIVSAHPDRLLPVPAVDPGLPRWTDDLDRAREAGAPGVRVYPMHQGIDPAGPEMGALVAAAAAAALVVVLTVRFEDGRQRHPLDVASDLPASTVRALARLEPNARILVTHADRAFIEEVHFGLTSDEAARVLWEISWIWGPPESHLALLTSTLGAERFAFGTGMPLRIPDAALAKLDLVDLTADQRRLIMGANLVHWGRGGA